MKQSTLLDLAGSDSDDSFSARTSVHKTADKMPAAKKPTGRAAANRITKAEPKAATRRAGANKAEAVEKEMERQALADKSKNQQPKSTRGRKAKKAAEEEDAEADDVLATPPGSDEPVRVRGGRGRPKNEFVVPDSAQKKEQPAAKRGRKATKKQDPAPQQFGPSEIPETQLDDPMDMDAEEQDQVEDLPMFSRFSAPPSAQRASSYHAPLRASNQPTTSSLLESDPSAIRRLGEMAKKYEALELKYKDLRNVTVAEAEKTFDRLRKASEEKTHSM